MSTKGTTTCKVTSTAGPEPTAHPAAGTPSSTFPQARTAKRRQKTQTFDTKRQAQAWLAKTSEEIRTGDLPDDTITVGAFLTQWLEGRKNLAPSTRVDYTRHIQQVFIPELGHLKLAALRARHIEEVLDRLQKSQEARRQPLSAKTLQRILATLRSALGTAVKRGLITRNPAVTVELPKPERYRAEGVDPGRGRPVPPRHRGRPLRAALPAHAHHRDAPR